MSHSCNIGGRFLCPIRMHMQGIWAVHGQTMTSNAGPKEPSLSNAGPKEPSLNDLNDKW